MDQPRREPLDPERIVTVAIELLDDVGLDGLSLRRLAARLGVANPALYWHFTNKQEILDGIATRLLERAVVETVAGETWDAWLRRAATAFREALLSHRDGARVVASADLSKSSMAGGHFRALEPLVADGFSPADAFTGVLAVFDYALGATFEQQADPVRSPAGGDETFAGGIQLLLDGMALRRRPR